MPITAKKKGVSRGAMLVAKGLMKKMMGRIGLSGPARLRVAAPASGTMLISP
jgi:hypothetical protein